MVQIKKEINGREYTFEVGRNYIVMESIRGDKGHYKIGHRYDGSTSQILFKSNTEQDVIKVIGWLLYDFEKDIITYRKYISESVHEYHKTNSLGVNWEVISNLCPKDIIKIIVDNGKKQVVHTISVSKALKYQDFRYYKTQGYEKQLLIPIEAFKQKEISKKRRRSGANNQQRKTNT
jgi:hypothetical protein